LITRVFVDEAHRGKGLGAEIMFKAEEVSKELGAEKIALQVDETNVPALKLYENLNYQIHHEYVYRVLR
jgi:ribosomal protein S18 acetylase RimI-like enzyme